MTEHAVKVVQIGKIEKHPNADALELTQVEGYTCVLKLGEWQEGDIGVYVEPDYVVPTDQPWFSFLGTSARIRVKKLRGVYSQGLLIKRPPPVADAPVGANVMEALGITRWVTLEDRKEGVEPNVPTLLSGVAKYDLEGWRKFKHALLTREHVMITEKIHGENARYSWVDGRMWCGSRTSWKVQDPTSPWWIGLRDNPWILNWCWDHPGMILYGEVYGNVPKMRYGIKPGNRGFRTFDVFNPAQADLRLAWSSPFSRFTAEQCVPLLYEGPLPSDEVLLALAEGKSTLGDHVREGIVIEPYPSRWDEEKTHAGEHRLGRIKLKLVGNGYYELNT